MPGKKSNQLISAIRIEVERSIGRLKWFQRLANACRAKASSMAERRCKHLKLFYAAINLTNMWIDLYPMGKESHWLLCLDDIDYLKVRQVVKEFIARNRQEPLTDFLNRKFGGTDYLKRAE